MTNQDRAAQVLSQHWSVAQETGQDDECDCCAQALADAGLLMPDLPPDTTGEFDSGEWSAGFSYEKYWAGKFRTCPVHAYAESPGIIGISAPDLMDTDDAEMLALAILAAVRSDRSHHAEQEQGNAWD